LEQVVCILNLLDFSTSANIEFIPELEFALVTGFGVENDKFLGSNGREGDTVVDKVLE